MFRGASVRSTATRIVEPDGACAAKQEIESTTRREQVIDRCNRGTPSNGKRESNGERSSLATIRGIPFRDCWTFREFGFLNHRGHWEAQGQAKLPCASPCPLW